MSMGEDYEHKKHPVKPTSLPQHRVVWPIAKVIATEGEGWEMVNSQILIRLLGFMQLFVGG